MLQSTKYSSHRPSHHLTFFLCSEFGSRPAPFQHRQTPFAIHLCARLQWLRYTVESSCQLQSAHVLVCRTHLCKGQNRESSPHKPHLNLSCFSYMINLPFRGFLPNLVVWFLRRYKMLWTPAVLASHDLRSFSLKLQCKAFAKISSSLAARCQASIFCSRFAPLQKTQLSALIF